MPQSYEIVSSEISLENLFKELPKYGENIQHVSEIFTKQSFFDTMDLGGRQ